MNRGVRRLRRRKWIEDKVMDTAGWKTASLLAGLLVISSVTRCVGQTPIPDPDRPLALNFSEKGQGETDRYTAVPREMLIKTLLSLALVLGLGLGVIWTTKRLFPRLGVNAGKEIKVLETTGLGQRKALHLVKVGSQQLLIGSTPEHISMLTVVHTGFGDVMNARLDTEDAS
jgi:flagellar biosynthetic protein FliO